MENKHNIEDDFLKKILAKENIESPSPSFTDQVMTRIEHGEEFETGSLLKSRGLDSHWNRNSRTDRHGLCFRPVIPE